MATDWREEFLELIGEVREHVAFAQELGVGGLETEFVAEVAENSERQNQPKRAASEKTFSPTEAFVPEIRKPAATPKPAATTAVSETPRRSLSSLLEQTKLSKISQATAPQNSAPPKTSASNVANQSKQEGNEMTESSLFGDIAPEKETLPESNETPEEIRADIGDCVRCPLYQGRTKIVHTEGNWTGRVLFVGEAPGANEDAEGRPFVGRAGQLLTKIIEAIGLRREDVLIGNVNRCRPPQNRTPTIQEARTCRQFLMREIAVARPEIIVVMGNTATQNLLDTKEGITKIRGKFQDYYGVKVMPTFHPAYLLRDPSKKRETWEDMKKVRDELAKTVK
jgi:uracil-DNA glycosylase